MLTYEQNVKAILESVFAGYKDELIENACKGICTLKDTEEQKPKIGHWNDDYCSCCGERSYPYDMSGYGCYYYANYCPNCGAKMESEDNE